MFLIAEIITLAVLSYGAGSLPFGLIISKKVKGLDIRNFGSGNIGATNVARILGIKWAVLVFILDFLKGYLPVFLVFLILPKNSSLIPIVSIIVGLLAIAGHNWPLYLKFKGGKGVSTSIGVITSLSINITFLRIPVLLSVLAWVLLFLIFRIVGLASVISALIFFVLCIAFKGVSWEFKILSFLLSFFIIIRHRKNIKEVIERYKVR